MILAPKARPVSAIPLFVRSASVPATCVPWLSSSSGWLSWSTKSWPGRNWCEEKSGERRKRPWFSYATPESIRAILTPLPPGAPAAEASAQACGAFTLNGPVKFH